VSDLPLLDAIEQAEAVRAGQLRAESAASHAERVAPGWREQALDAVRLHATRHERFLAEHVALPVPSTADRRAMGAIMPEAARRGWIKRDGFALDSYGSPKSSWRSLIVGGAA
jgi:hypothetical protein